MHWLDSSLLAVLAAAAVFGAYSGLLMQVCRLAGFAVALYVATVSHPNTSAWLQEGPMRGSEVTVCNSVAYGILFLSVYMAIFFGTLILERGVRAANLQSLNRGLGALLAVGKMSFLIGVVCYGVQQLRHEPTSQILSESNIAPFLAKGVEQVIAAVPTENRDDWLRGLHQFRDSLPINKDKSKDAVVPPPLISKLQG